MKDLEAATTEASLSPRQIFGKQLAGLREEKGLTRRDVVHLTRISPPFLEALEEGDFDKLPGEVFGRGFLRSVCKVLEVDHEELVKLYNSAYVGQESQVSRRKSLRRRQGDGEALWGQLKKLRLPSPFLFVGLTVTLSIGLSIYLGKVVHQKADPVPVEKSHQAALPFETPELDPAEDLEESSVRVGEEMASSPSDAELSVVAKEVAPAVVEPQLIAVVSPQFKEPLVELFLEEAAQVEYQMDGNSILKERLLPGGQRFLFDKKIRLRVLDDVGGSLHYAGKKIEGGSKVWGRGWMSFHRNNVQLKTVM